MFARSMTERTAARLLTGPPAFLLAGAIEIVAFGLRTTRSRMTVRRRRQRRRREPGRQIS